MDRGTARWINMETKAKMRNIGQYHYDMAHKRCTVFKSSVWAHVSMVSNQIKLHFFQLLLFVRSRVSVGVRECVCVPCTPYTCHEKRDLWVYVDLLAANLAQLSNNHDGIL